MPTTQPINAKSETVATNGMFRQPFARRRCRMPADGFYEWLPAGPHKVPYFFRRPDDQPFAFAAVWDVWRPDEEAEPVETCCLLTTSPGPDIKGMHHRMPVILRPQDYVAWMNTETPADDLHELLKPSPGGTLERWAVSTRVNNVRNVGPDLVEPAIE